MRFVWHLLLLGVAVPNGSNYLCAMYGYGTEKAGITLTCRDTLNQHAAQNVSVDTSNTKWAFESERAVVDGDTMYAMGYNYSTVPCCTQAVLITIDVSQAPKQTKLIRGVWLPATAEPTGPLLFDEAKNRLLFLQYAQGSLVPEVMQYDLKTFKMSQVATLPAEIVCTGPTLNFDPHSRVLSGVFFKHQAEIVQWITLNVDSGKSNVITMDKTKLPFVLWMDPSTNPSSYYSLLSPDPGFIQHVQLNDFDTSSATSAPVPGSPVVNLPSLLVEAVAFDNERRVPYCFTSSLSAEKFSAVPFNTTTGVMLDTFILPTSWATFFLPL